MKPLNQVPRLDVWDGCLAASLMLLGAVAFLLCFQGVDGGDGVWYAECSAAFLQGQHLEWSQGGPPVYAVRIGILAPTALAIQLFGRQEWPVLLYPMLVSVANLGVAYAVARICFGRVAAVLACLTYIAIPLVLRQGTMVNGEMPGAYWANMGMLLVLLAERWRSSPRSVAVGVLAGVAFGLAWLHKESVAYLAPALGVWLLYRISKDRRIWRVTGAIAAGAAAILLLEGCYYQFLNGDPLYHFHAAQRNFEYNGRFHYFYEGSPHGWQPGHYGEALRHRLFVEGPRRILGANVSVKVALLAVLLALATRDASFGFVGTWFIGVALMFNFFTTDFRVYRPLVLEARYLTPLFLPASVLAGGLLGRLLIPRPPCSSIRRYAGIAAAAVLVLFILRSDLPGWQIAANSGPTYREARRFAESLPDGSRVVTDPKTAIALGWLGYSERLRIEGFSAEPPEEGSYVLLYWGRLRMNQTYGKELPSFVMERPPHWRQLVKERDFEVYLVGYAVSSPPASVTPKRLDGPSVPANARWPIRNPFPFRLSYSAGEKASR